MTLVGTSDTLLELCQELSILYKARYFLTSWAAVRVQIRALLYVVSTHSRCR
jgi:hypothetical protein